VTLNKKAAFIIWYFVLWGVCTWAIFELFYPHTDYGNPGVMYYFAAGFSLLLLVATGVPLFLYVRKRKIGRKSMLILLGATVLLVGCLAPNARAFFLRYDSISQVFILLFLPHKRPVSARLGNVSNHTFAYLFEKLFRTFPIIS